MPAFLIAAAAALAVACGFSVIGSNEALETSEAGADGSPNPLNEAGLSGDGEVDAGPVVCRWPSLEPNAVWPMLGGCVDHPGRTIFDGPHQMPAIKFSANVRKVFYSFLVGRANGTVLATADVEGIISIDPNDGGTSLLVDAGPTQYNITSAPAIGADGTIYFGSGDFIASYRPPNQSWRFDTTGEIDTSVVLAADGTVIAGSFSNFLYGLDPVDGGKRWQADLGSDISSSPAINRTTDMIYSCAGNHCFAIKPDGGQEWDYNANTSVSLGAPVIGNDGTVYVMTSGGELRALQPEDKTVKWTFPTRGPGPTILHLPAAIALDGTIYTGQSDRLNALTPEDAGLKWEADVGDQVRTSLLIDGSGVVFLGTTGNFIVAVSPTGAVLWRLRVDQQPEAIMIGRDGTLYVMCTNAMVYALR